MKNFDKEKLKNLEKLSRIKCTPKEEPALLKGISNILNYFEQLKEIDTKNVEETVFVLQDLELNVMREDLIKETITTEEFLSNSPDQVALMIKVPPIIKEL